VGGSAFVQLTEAVNDQNGSFLFNTPPADTDRRLHGYLDDARRRGHRYAGRRFSFVLGEDIADGSLVKMAPDPV